VNVHTPIPPPTGSFASGQAGDVVTGANDGSFARRQVAASDPALRLRQGSFATGQAVTDPSTWATGRFSTGQEHRDPRLIRSRVSIDARRAAQAGAVD
jgi:hypothetical protein